jgi:hypothetical protein
LYWHLRTREELMNAVRRQARDDADSDEEDYLRPPGELTNISNAPLSVEDVLNKVPPFQLSKQIIAESPRLPGISFAPPYVRGSRRRQHAASRGGRDVSPSDQPSAARRPRDRTRGRRGDPVCLRRALTRATVAPLQLRSRALRSGRRPFDRARLHRPRRHPPARPRDPTEPPAAPDRPGRRRDNRGKVLPGCEIGGDWFDYAENPRGGWLGIADAAGTGPSAAGIGAVTLGAFRSIRRESTDPTESLLAVHEVLLQLGEGHATSSATVGL